MGGERPRARSAGGRGAARAGAGSGAASPPPPGPGSAPAAAAAGPGAPPRSAGPSAARWSRAPAALSSTARRRWDSSSCSFSSPMSSRSQGAPALGGGGDVGVGGLDLTAEEVHLLADLLQPLPARPGLLLRRRQIVGQHLELVADLAEAGVDLPGGVDHRGADQDAVGGHERGPGMLALLRRGVLERAPRRRRRAGAGSRCLARPGRRRPRPAACARPPARAGPDRRRRSRGSRRRRPARRRGRPRRPGTRRRRRGVRAPPRGPARARARRGPGPSAAPPRGRDATSGSATPASPRCRGAARPARSLRACIARRPVLQRLEPLHQRVTLGLQLAPLDLQRRDLAVETVAVASDRLELGADLRDPHGGGVHLLAEPRGLVVGGSERRYGRSGPLRVAPPPPLRRRRRSSSIPRRSSSARR